MDGPLCLQSGALCAFTEFSSSMPASSLVPSLSLPLPPSHSPSLLPSLPLSLSFSLPLSLSCPSPLPRVDTNIPSHPLCRQEGVFRVNCMDCLDRTNVVQTAFCRQVLQSAVSTGLLHSRGFCVNTFSGLAATCTCTCTCTCTYLEEGHL